MKPILLIKTGSTIPGIIPAHGDFEDWFAAAMGVTDLARVDVYLGEELPEHGEVEAVVVTGSKAMVSHREDWSEGTADWLRVALDMRVPILGVCYGHQLLAHALGGEVGPNPKGREMGTVQVVCEAEVAEDPLFSAGPREFPVQATHLESVLAPPAGAGRLARSELDENMILRFGEHAWGVQYHPEFSAEVMREYIRRRARDLREEALDPEVMLARVSETPVAGAVLEKFARRYGSAKAA